MNRPAEIPCVHLTAYAPHPRVGRLVPEAIARRNGLVPLDLEGNRLVVACANPRNRQALWDVSNATRMILKPVLAPYPEIRTLLDRIYDCPECQPVFPGPGEMAFILGHAAAIAEVLQAAVSPPGSQTNVQKRENIASLGAPVEKLDPQAEAEINGWRLGLPQLRPQNLNPQEDLLLLVSKETAQVSSLLPLWWVAGALVVLAPDNRQGELPHYLPGLPGIPILPVVCDRYTWERLYRKIFLQGGAVPGLDARGPLRWMVKKGLLSELDLTGITTISQQTGRPPEEIGLENHIFTRETWLLARAQYFEIPLASQPSGSRREMDGLAEIFPEGLAHRLRAIPLGRSGDTLVLGVEDPNPQVVRLVEHLTGLEVEPRLIDPERYEDHLDTAYRDYRRPGLVRIPELDELLLCMGLVTQGQIDQAVGKAALPTESLEDTLLRLGFVDERDLAEVLSIQAGVPNVSLERAGFDQVLIQEMPSGLLSQHGILPLAKLEEDLWVAVADPFDGSGMAALEFATGLRVRPLVAPRSVITGGLERTLGRQARTVSPEIRDLVQAFVQKGWLTQFEAARALKSFGEGAYPIDRAILTGGRMTEEQVAQRISELLQLPLVDLNLFEETVEVIDPLGERRSRQVIHDPVNQGAARLIDLATAQRFQGLPIRQVGDMVTIVFAAPPSGQTLAILENLLHRQVIASLSTRSGLEAAIQRVLGRQNLGTRMLLSGVINRKQLNEALDLAERSGVRLGKALISSGAVSQKQLYIFLAEQSGLPFWTLDLKGLDGPTVRSMDADEERRFGMIPLAVQEQRVKLAMTDPFNEAALEYAARRFPGGLIEGVLITEADLEKALEAVYSRDYLARSVSELLERSPEDSAFRVLSRGQVAGLAAFLLLSAAWIFFDHLSYFIIINLISTIFYLGFSAYKFYLIYQAMTGDLEVPVSPEEIEALDDRDLPVYTLLIPVFREAEVLPDLLEGLTRLDYPPTKLDIKVLMEADDEETIAAFRALAPPDQFQAIIVPYAQPKTKPKACNYGLIHARGDYIVIYDAEDLPERDQLKKVLVGFQKSDPRVICIQTKLNYYNRNQNLLTRWFTVEYSMWFDLFLPGLDASMAPIPLGGTSNHFRRDALIECGAWDPYNVTEDADLGVRVFKRGYRTAIVDSTTYEEANSQLYNWIRQRSRWIKGYIQTWLVHMRHPLKLIDEIGFKAFMSFQFVVGGTFFAALINPIYWMFTTLWFFTHWDFIQTIYPGVIFFIGAVCLYLGNFVFTYVNVAGAMRRGYYDMVKYALISPLYWGLASLAAWRGFLQLLRKPHFWEKTVHGLYDGQILPEEEAKDGNGSQPPPAEGTTGGTPA